MRTPELCHRVSTSRTPARGISFWIIAMTLLLNSSLFAKNRLAAATEPKAKRSEVSAALFEESTVRVFDLQIPPAELSQLTRSSKTYVPAELR